MTHSHLFAVVTIALMARATSADTTSFNTSAVDTTSSGSESSSGLTSIEPPALESCASTAFQSLYTYENTSYCKDLSGFSFTSPSSAVTAFDPVYVCGYASCSDVYDQIQSLNLTADCYLTDTIQLVRDIMVPLNCSSFNHSSSSGSSGSNDMVSVGSYTGSGSLDWASSFPPSSNTSDSNTNNTTTIVVVVSLAVGLLLAFIAVVVAVVWYKRQRFRDLHRAYGDPLMLAKQAAGVGASGGVGASERANGSGNVHSLNDTMQSSSGENDSNPEIVLSGSNHHGATLWGDDELLARHMRNEDLEDIRVIGSGGHCVVLLVRYRQGRLLASKRLVRDSVTRAKTRMLISEIKLCARLDHPCIVEFVGAAWTTESDLQALFEYMPNGDLCTFLAKTSNNTTWTLSKIQIAMDIVEALVYVHSFAPPLVHRDLKSRNVLLTNDLRAKLSDFGVSRYQSDNCTMTAGVGTSRWLAPEVMAGDGEYNQKCDIYSLGMVLSEMDTHRLPFAGLKSASGNPMAEVSILQLVSVGKLQPTFSQACPVSLRALALKCLAFDPRDRPGAIEVSYALRTIAKNEFGR